MSVKEETALSSERRTRAGVETAGDPVPEDAYAVAPRGYRLPRTTRLGPVRLQVSDLGQSLAYYESLLGFRVLQRDADLAVLGAQDGDRPLVVLVERRGASPVPRRGRLGLYHFAVLLPDRAALGRFLAHLTQRGVQPGASDHLVSEALYLQDPDGLGIEVYADRPRNTWRTAGRQLDIGTEPLDVDSVIGAGAGKPWTGMPSGTTIGHVHLHVGDLTQASDFYHQRLGFDEITRIPGALFLSAGGYHHHLGTNTWAAGAARPTESDARLLEWTIELPNSEEAAAAARSLAEGGYDVRTADADWLVADPWGTFFRLVHGGA
jgi:catechol 2,3-dioxygenase